jgi:DNA-directed RNA polymerase subunit RPC12/RpoP
MIRCPYCNNDRIMQWNELDEFSYGDPPVKLICEIRVSLCVECDREFIDSSNEDRYNQAINRHLSK